jgi:hypothetical protein
MGRKIVSKGKNGEKIVDEYFDEMPNESKKKSFIVMTPEQILRDEQPMNLNPQTGKVEPQKEITEDKPKLGISVQELDPATGKIISKEI